eukprot:744489_1
MAQSNHDEPQSTASKINISGSSIQSHESQTNDDESSQNSMDQPHRRSNTDIRLQYNQLEQQFLNLRIENTTLHNKMKFYAKPVMQAKDKQIENLQKENIELSVENQMLKRELDELQSTDINDMDFTSDIEIHRAIFTRIKDIFAHIKQLQIQIETITSTPANALASEIADVNKKCDTLKDIYGMLQRKIPHNDTFLETCNLLNETLRSMTEEIRDVKQLIQPQIIQNISDTLAQIKADYPAYFQSIEQRLMHLSEETASYQNENETKTTELERIKHLMMNELKLELTALFQTQNQTQGNIVDAVKEYADKIRDE